ncbi:hypothetical protein NEOLEDRAFT_1140203 [Neolentinus lepideus HHB14362 ss-1]|uniref:Uncharacterized protein n=1 Tax=Neolentinus lepideus HHB14362 ss-1 TaxID=1314782 RepID=A0A165PDC4_9AGAM|nr:hypothetical protein NEOLEDRAFT_1140203 [Neolentinus lepideus HHB14362 ss-1]
MANKKGIVSIPLTIDTYQTLPSNPWLSVSPDLPGADLGLYEYGLYLCTVVGTRRVHCSGRPNKSSQARSHQSA